MGTGMSKTVGINEIAAKLGLKPSVVGEWYEIGYLMFPEPAGHESGTVTSSGVVYV